MCRRIAAAQKFTGRIIPGLAGGQDQLAIQVGVEPIEMEPPAVSVLDVWAEDQGQMAAAIICDTRTLRRRPRRRGPIHRGMDGQNENIRIQADSAIGAPCTKVPWPS